MKQNLNKKEKKVRSKIVYIFPNEMDNKTFIVSNYPVRGYKPYKLTPSNK